MELINAGIEIIQLANSIDDGDRVSLTCCPPLALCNLGCCTPPPDGIGPTSSCY